MNLSPLRRTPRLFRVAALLATLTALGAAATPALAQQPITGDFRLLQLNNFIEDAGLIRSTWLEARGDYADWGDGGKDKQLTAVAAFAFAERFEVGGSFGYLDRSRTEDQVLFGEELGGDFSNNGFGDSNLFGKFQIAGGEKPWAAGLVVKLATGDESEGLGSGAADYELFVANRRTREKRVFSWNGGVRFNGDPEVSGTGSGDTSFFVGGGWIFRLSYSWSFLAEGRVETKRYEGDDTAAIVTPSFDYRPTENIALRLGIGLGFTDGAPDQTYTFGFVFHL
ncbi:MAG TPA: hypothetical protein VFW45_08150 [Candidatus Polarisedimenticolia bacterium]|nr:hypothetical protein [Candidatus Polarisedimenticolia bacterium]